MQLIVGARYIVGNHEFLKDSEVTIEHIEKYHLVVWGTPKSNSLLREALPDLPIHWDQNHSLKANGQNYNPEHHIPLLIHPNPLNPHKYIILNSGPTHREAHDRTNSCKTQNLATGPSLMFVKSHLLNPLDV